MWTLTALLNLTTISTRMKVSSISNSMIIRKSLLRILRQNQVKPLFISNHKNLSRNTMIAKISWLIKTQVEEVEAVANHLVINLLKFLQLKTTTMSWSTCTTAASKSSRITWVSSMVENNSRRVSSWLQTTRIFFTRMRVKSRSLVCWGLTSKRRIWYVASLTSAHLTWSCKITHKTSKHDDVICLLFVS